MKTVAAVLVELGKPLELADLEIPALKPGQVLVEIAFSGVCQTQVLEARGLRGADPFVPHCLGHEAGGTVLEIGTGVTKVAPGRKVILSWIKGSGHDVPGTVYDWNGRKVNAGGVTTFARHAVVAENRLTPIDDTFPLEDAALLGCAVPTGLGAVFNTAAPRPGQSLAVFGCGGVGLCAVAAGRIGGQTPIIAVDVDAGRLEAARQMGASYRIDATTGDPVAEILKLVPGGVDFAVEASGRPEVMNQALSAVRNQGGAAVLVGNAPFGRKLEIDPKQFNLGKRLLGTWGGDNLPDRDFPRYQRLVRDGLLSLRPLTDRTYSLAAINQAVDDLESRRATRPLVDMSQI
jgi:S-(hydroxymethyl)glutathione dehydrogenase / alcohol dehydrogenase